MLFRLKPSSHQLLCILSILTGTLIAYGYYFFYQYSDGAIPFPEAICELPMTSCTTRLSTGEELTLTLTTTQLPAFSPLRIHLSSKNLHILNASLEFKNPRQNMGKNQPTLLIQKDGSFQGNTLLPKTAADQVYWLAIVHVETQGGVYSAVFPFIIESKT